MDKRGLGCAVCFCSGTLSGTVCSPINVFLPCTLNPSQVLSSSFVFRRPSFFGFLGLSTCRPPFWSSFPAVSKPTLQVIQHMTPMSPLHTSPLTGSFDSSSRLRALCYHLCSSDYVAPIKVPALSQIERYLMCWPALVRAPAKRLWRAGLCFTFPPASSSSDASIFGTALIVDSDDQSDIEDIEGNDTLRPALKTERRDRRRKRQVGEAPESTGAPLGPGSDLVSLRATKIENHLRQW
ncbi:hypothetical protein EDB85DRAFT_1905120 [Lactarius pseudohatsudake]|nr:hypothetical protein EDB85DRAFT_1905120 [Lactarius pseudohatsudake]